MEDTLSTTKQVLRDKSEKTETINLSQLPDTTVIERNPLCEKAEPPPKDPGAIPSKKVSSETESVDVTELTVEETFDPILYTDEQFCDSFFDKDLDLIAAVASISDDPTVSNTEGGSGDAASLFLSQEELVLPDTLVDIAIAEEERILDHVDESVFDLNPDSDPFLKQIASLSLGEDPLTAEIQSLGIAEDTEDDLPSYLYCQEVGRKEVQQSDDENGDSLPEYLYCQPCATSPPEDARNTGQLVNQFRGLGLAPVSETSTLQDGVQVVEGPVYNYHHDNNDIDIMNIPYDAAGPASRLDQHFQSYIVSRRSEAVQAALAYTASFGTGIYQPEPRDGTSPLNERSGFGHKETIYGIHFSPCGTWVATASQDSTVCVWNAAKHALEHTLTGHSKENEVLRVTWASKEWGSTDLKRDGEHCQLIASGSADGIVKVWALPSSSKDNESPTWSCVATIDHSQFENRPAAVGEDGKPTDPPQIYGLQFIDDWKGFSNASVNSMLLTSSDDYVHLWEVENVQQNRLYFIEVLSIRFTDLHSVGYGVSLAPVTSNGLSIDNKNGNRDTATTVNLQNGAPSSVPFGGERNPDNVIFVFDVAYTPAHGGLLGVALSDGSLRLVNGRGVCLGILSLPGSRSHLTSMCWSADGYRLACCVATGHLILWELAFGADRRLWPHCVAVLEGGHTPGTPIFGAQYCGEDNLILTWGGDGKLCLWDAHSSGNIHMPISVLLNKSDYPVYAVDVMPHTTDDNNDQMVSRIALGGGREGGFIGIPTYFYDVKPLDQGRSSSDSKKE